MVRITKKSIFFEFVEELPDGKDEVRSIDVYQIGSGLVSYLNQEVVIESDVTVMDMFSHIAMDVANINFAMDASLHGHQLQIYIDEIKDDGPTEPGMTGMEIAHQTDPIGADMELADTPRFRGVGDNGITYYVEFASMSAYKHLPIRLNETYKMFDVKGNAVFTGFKEFRLYDVLHAILNEISYHGTPADRKKVFMERLEELSNDEEMISDTVDSLQEELERSVKDENYEKAAKIRDMIERMKNHH